MSSDPQTSCSFDHPADWPCPICSPGCRCIACQDAVPGLMRYMPLCSVCGYKRCPKATDHRRACTGSNEPGQAGSAYVVGERSDVIHLSGDPG